jgi:hypothetical protein
VISTQLRDIKIIVDGLDAISAALEEAHESDEGVCYGDGFWADFQDAVTIQTDAAEPLGQIIWNDFQWDFQPRND